jgi:MOSC domain-containing protein YiiM
VSEQAGDVQTGVSWTGRIAGIFVAPAGGAPTRPVERARAVPGRGLEGDRNFAAPPAPTHKNPDEELTLFSLEALAEANREYGLSLAPGDTRRNVATEGVPINDLVGREFRLGNVRVRGLELCEPCLHLAELTGERQILRALVHRGGLRAQILSEGTLTVGDPINLAADQAS